MSRLRGKHGDRTVAGVSLGYEDEYSVRFTGQGCSCSINWRILFDQYLDCSMTSNMKSKTFWREYDDMNEAVGVKQVVVGAKGDYVILG